MGILMNDTILTPLWEEYQQRRNRWVAHNFPNDSIKDSMMESMMGIIEEVGELAHAHLKQRQAIRGDDSAHVSAAKDAVGDATVYLWGITAAGNMDFNAFFWNFVSNYKEHKLPPTRRAVGTEADVLILAVTHAAAKLNKRVLLEMFKQSLTPLHAEHVAPLVGALWDYCDTRNWDYPLIVDETWTHVEKRDWIKFPFDGYSR